MIVLFNVYYYIWCVDTTLDCDITSIMWLHLDCDYEFVIYFNTYVIKSVIHINHVQRINYKTCNVLCLNKYIYICRTLKCDGTPKCDGHAKVRWSAPKCDGVTRQSAMVCAKPRWCDTPKCDGLHSRIVIIIFSSENL